MQHGCCTKICLQTWTLKEIHDCSVGFAANPDQKKREILRNLLQLQRTEQKGPSTSRIAGKLFNLRVHNKPICSRALCVIYPVAYNVLADISKTLDETSDTDTESEGEALDSGNRVLFLNDDRTNENSSSESVPTPSYEALPHPDDLENLNETV